MKKLVAALLLLVLLTDLSACESPETPVRATVIQAAPHVLDEWPVQEAVDFYRNITGSVEEFGTCRFGAKCVIVQELVFGNTRCGNGQVIGCTVGRTDKWEPNIVVIQVKRSVKGDLIRDRLLKHELGHAYGIDKHNPSCLFLMHESINCAGSGLVSDRLSPEEVEIVRGN